MVRAKQKIFRDMAKYIQKKKIRLRIARNTKDEEDKFEKYFKTF